MALQLLAAAQKFLAGKAWSSEMVLNMGAELLSVANLIPSLSFQDKTSLVCQTILKMLDGVEKVGKEHLAESTGIVLTTAQLEEYKNLVRMLPVILEHLNTRLAPVACLPLQGCLPSFSFGSLSWSCVRKQAVETVSAVEDVLKHPQEYLEEMRDLVSKAEKLLSSHLTAPAPVLVAPVPEPAPVAPEPLPEPVTVPVAVESPEPIPQQTPEPAASAFAAAAESLLEPRPLPLPPSPVLSGEQLPGGLAIPEEVELSL